MNSGTRANPDCSPRPTSRTSILRSIRSADMTARLPAERWSDRIRPAWPGGAARSRDAAGASCSGLACIRAVSTARPYRRRRRAWAIARMSALGDRAQPFARLSAQLAYDGLQQRLGLIAAAVGDRVDDPALAGDQLDHRLVDRLGGQQVPGRHRVLLADAVAAVLGLVVDRGRPLQIQERDVGGARQRDPLRAHARGADDQLRAALLLERAHRVLARLGRVAAEQVRGVREALEHEVLDLAMAAEHDERLVTRQEVVDPRQRR